jgi:hypothetical protein
MTAALTALFLSLAFSAIVVLDEFARLPFYNTTMMAALLTAGVSLIMILRTQGRVLASIRSGAATAKGGRWLLRRLGLPRRSDAATVRPNTDNGFRGQRSRQPSPREVEIAMRKVHSTVWGFPAYSHVIDPMKEEARINHEIHR